MSDEILKKQNVDNGIALLSKDEVRSIVVVAKFGNFVSGTSRVIIKKFQEMRKWNCLECRYTDIPSYVEEIQSCMSMGGLACGMTTFAQ